jgi:chromosome segregation ATPase
MRKRFSVFTVLFPIAAACASSGASAQVPITRIPAVQDSAISESLRRSRDVLANVQRLLDDTTLFAAANRARENAAAVSVRLDAQQAALEQKLQQIQEHLGTVLQQVERIQRRLDEMMRQQRN